MNIAQIEKNLQKLLKSFDKETFIYDLLLAYGLPKASITRLKKGNLNLSKVEGEISWKKKLYFREVKKKDLLSAVTELSKSISHSERFVVVTDYKTFLAVDTKTQDKLDIDFKDLPKHYDFFLPWAGMEKHQHQNENPADVKAAERMAKLFDEIKKDNPNDDLDYLHSLNVFLSRMLFCFFAEDTNIFEENLFTKSIASHTQTDGSDLNVYLSRIFEVLNLPAKNRKKLPAHLTTFPYVNGGLFENAYETPIFTRRSRQMIIDAGELDWAAINPDIFGSMIQAVGSPEHRGGLGMHYTSVPNIMKVIEPLFLNDLKEEFEKAKNSPKKLNLLLAKLSRIKIFDPACGSGNFLIIAYKELRTLEIKIIQELQRLQRVASGFDRSSKQLELIPKAQLTLAASFQVELFSRIELAQFYGIEINAFACEVAKLSLWLAEHQMNLAFFKEFGKTNPTLPLKEAGNIVWGNACRLDWEEVCPKSKESEVYILGNPPYLGARLQSVEQKLDMKFVFENLKGLNNLDYISCWFKKASDFIVSSYSKYAFVTTNSISQGEQVVLLWPTLLKNDLEIQFAHQSFKWTNNARKNAGVTVAIVGVGSKNAKNKNILKDGLLFSVKNINPYLIKGKINYITKRRLPISMFPTMPKGNMPYDGGHLILNSEETQSLIKAFPSLKNTLKNL